MEERIKRRLVGAIVLVSLAIIFVPMMLDGRGGEQQLAPGIPARDTGPYNEQLSQSLPEPPIVPIRQAPEAVSQPEPEPTPATAPAPPPEVVAPPAARPAPTKPAHVVSAARPLTAWVVQVGSFSRHEGAEAVAGKLRAAGFDTQVEKASVNGQTVYRVQAGPEVDKARAEALRERIRDKLKLDGKVLSYPSA